MDERGTVFLTRPGKNFGAVVQQSIGAYMEFGAILADYGILKDRYTRMRMLEAEDPLTRATAVFHDLSPSSHPVCQFFILRVTASERRPKSPIGTTQKPRAGLRLGLLSNPPPKKRLHSGSEALMICNWKEQLLRLLLVNC